MYRNEESVLDYQKPISQECGCHIDNDTLFLCSYHSNLGNIPDDWDEMDTDAEREKKTDV